MDFKKTVGLIVLVFAIVLIGVVIWSAEPPALNILGMRDGQVLSAGAVIEIRWDDSSAGHDAYYVVSIIYDNLVAGGTVVQKRVDQKDTTMSLPLAKGSYIIRVRLLIVLRRNRSCRTRCLLR
jgi:hypothetical protein